jgi:hypothetical protein
LEKSSRGYEKNVDLNLNVNFYNKVRFFCKKVGFEIIKEEDIPFGEYWMNDFLMLKILT